MRINNENDWWSVVDTYWSGLLDILWHKLDPDYEAYEIPGDATSAPTGRTVKNELKFLKENRDGRLARYLAAVWFMASEDYARERVYGWNAMCDLLSEEWVIIPDEI